MSCAVMTFQPAPAKAPAVEMKAEPASAPTTSPPPNHHPDASQQRINKNFPKVIEGSGIFLEAIRRGRELSRPGPSHSLLQEQAVPKSPKTFRISASETPQLLSSVRSAKSRGGVELVVIFAIRSFLVFLVISLMDSIASEA